MSLHRWTFGMTAKQAKFAASLNHASRVVATWPDWKRNLLGRTKAESPLTDPPTTGSVTGCSMEDQPASDAGQRPEPAPPGNPVSCRYQWVGDRMRERLDALEKERPRLKAPQFDNSGPLTTAPGLCHREFCDTRYGGKCNCL